MRKIGKFGYFILIVLIVALIFSIPYFYEILNLRNIDEISSEVSIALNNADVSKELNDLAKEYDFSIVVQSDDLYYSTFDTNIENVSELNLSNQYYNELDSENGFYYSLYIPPIDFDIIYPYILFTLLLIITLILIWNAIFVNFIIRLIIKPMNTLKNNIHNLRNYEFIDVESGTKDKINAELIKFSEDLNGVLKQYNVKISQKENEYYQQVVLNEKKESYLTTVIHDFKGELDNIQAGCTDEATSKLLSRLKMQTEENIKLAVTKDEQYFLTKENINLKTYLFKLLNTKRDILDAKDIFIDFDVVDHNIEANEVIINQFFTNVISNAIKHTQRFGTIRVELVGDILSISNDVDEPVEIEKIFRLDYSSKNSSKIGYGMYRIKQIAEEIGWGLKTYNKDSKFIMEINFKDTHE